MLIVDRGNGGWGREGTAREEQVGKLPLSGNAAAEKPCKEKKSGKLKS